MESKAKLIACGNYFFEVLLIKSSKGQYTYSQDDNQHLQPPNQKKVVNDPKRRELE